MVVPTPIRLLSRLPPVGIGGIESTESCDLGARPMQPTCMLIGILAGKGSKLYLFAGAQ